MQILRHYPLVQARFREMGRTRHDRTADSGRRFASFMGRLAGRTKDKALRDQAFLAADEGTRVERSWQ